MRSLHVLSFLLLTLPHLCVRETQAQGCSPGVVVQEVQRSGTPRNRTSLLPGRTQGPVLGGTWDPWVPPASLLPSASLHLLMITPGAANVSTPFGTLLCDLSFPPAILTTAPGPAFAVPIPGDCSLAGLTLTAQGGATDGTSFLFGNALDITLGSRDTLYREFSGEIDSRLQAAGTPASAKPIYSSQDFTNQVFVRNPNCWAADIDLTGISPWNQLGGARRAGTLISPRHIAFATHYSLSSTPGSNEIVFVTDQNVTVRRQIVAVATAVADIRIGLLDADVPQTIKHYKVLPQDWSNWLLQTNDIPMLHLDQQEFALVRDMNRITTSSSYVFHAGPLDPLRQSFSETLIGGDSGNPAFLVLDGEAILVLTHHYATGGPFYTFYRNQVNAAMTQLGGGYQLTELDLASR